MILELVRSGTTYIDVGANIGLLSVPILANSPEVKVISIEASPATLPYLQRTWVSTPRRRDWTIVSAAVGETMGKTTFWTGGGPQGAFDGLRDTGRGGLKSPVDVDVTTIDNVWETNGSPPVSVIKMDIEGGESQALRGASSCIRTTKPMIILEWTSKNLAAYGVQPDSLLQFCAAHGYAAYAVPGLMHANSKTTLRLAMLATETFLLAPVEEPSPSV